VDSVKRAVPTEMWTPELSIALGLSLLHAHKEPTISLPAADLLSEGVRAAGRSGKQNLADSTVSAMFTAYALAHYFLAAQGNTASADSALKYMTAIKDKYGADLFNALDADDMFRIASAAAGARDWDAAYAFCARTIAKDPRDRRPYLLRLVTTYRRLDAGLRLQSLAIAATGDAETVLRLIDDRRQEFKQRQIDFAQRRGVYWIKGTTIKEVDSAELDDMARDGALARQLRAYLLAALDKPGSSTARPRQPKTAVQQ